MPRDHLNSCETLLCSPCSDVVHVDRDATPPTLSGGEVYQVAVAATEAWAYCYLCFRLRDFPATLYAMAMACFCGLPACISVRIFWEIVLRDLPFRSGIMLSFWVVDSEPVPVELPIGNFQAHI